MGSISVALNSAGPRVHSWSRVYSGTFGRLTPWEKSIEITHPAMAIKTRMITVNPMGATTLSTVSLSMSASRREAHATRGMRTALVRI